MEIGSKAGLTPPYGETRSPRRESVGGFFSRSLCSLVFISVDTVIFWCRLLTQCPKTSAATRLCPLPGTKPGQRPTDLPQEGGRYVDTCAELSCCA